MAWQTLKEKRDDFGRLLAFGIGSMVGLQALINIAVATVSVPTKGLSLPLVSAGGSGLVITAAGWGLLYSVAKSQAADEAVIHAPEDEAMALRVLQKLLKNPVEPEVEATPADLEPEPPLTQPVLRLHDGHLEPAMRISPARPTIAFPKTKGMLIRNQGM